MCLSLFLSLSLCADDADHNDDDDDVCAHRDGLSLSILLAAASSPATANGPETMDP